MIRVKGTPFSISFAAIRMVFGVVLLYWNTPQSLIRPVYSASATARLIFSGFSSSYKISQVAQAAGSMTYCSPSPVLLMW